MDVLVCRIQREGPYSNVFVQYFLIFVFIYLFGLHQVLVVTHGIFVTVRGLWAHGLSSCDVWAWLPPGMWDFTSPARD